MINLIALCDWPWNVLHFTLDLLSELCLQNDNESPHQDHVIILLTKVNQVMKKFALDLGKCITHFRPH